MIAQLTFRGMPLAHGMTLAWVIRLNDLEPTEVQALLKAVVELPTPVLPGKHITWEGHTFQSLGEAVCHCIVAGIYQKHNIDKIGQLIRVLSGLFPTDLRTGRFQDPTPTVNAPAHISPTTVWLSSQPNTETLITHAHLTPLNFLIETVTGVRPIASNK